MDSPIILLVLWFIINVVIKSAKDKKKIEEARQKRARQLNSRPINKPSTSNSKNIHGNKGIIELLREEIEKEMNRGKEIQSTKQQRSVQSPINEKKATTQNVVMDVATSVDTDKPESLTNIKKNEEKQLHIDLKNDLLKGIIFSEILSEPKSIQNIKRSM